MRHTIAVLVLLLTTTCSVGAAAAQTSSPNAGAVVSIHSAPLRAPVLVVPQPDSGSLVILLDIRDGTTDVYAQRLDRRGKALLGESGTLVWDVLANEYPDAVMADGSGGCILAMSRPNGASGRDIILKRVAGDGSLPYGPNGIVICNATRDQTRPVLAAGPSGSYYVAWVDDRSGSGGYYWDVYAQRVSLAGAPLWSANGIKVNAAGYRTASGNGIVGFCADGSGGLLLQWWSEATPTSRAQRLSSSGLLQWTANGVPVGVSNRGLGQIVPDGSGGFWGLSSDWDGTNSSFFVHRVLSTGALAFPAVGLAYHSPFAGSLQSTVTHNASGGCFIWSRQSYYNQGYTALVLQEVSGAGAMLRGTDGEVLAGAPLGVSVTESNGAIFVLSYDLNMGGSRGRARLQRYGLDATAQWPGVGVVLGRPEPAEQPGYAPVALSSTGLVHVAWADTRYLGPSTTANWQAFGQTFGASGTPLYDDPELPVLRTARDAPNDQGGFVRVTWDASLADHPAAKTARGYRVWRALPASAAAALTRSRPEGDGMFQSGERTLLLQSGLYWEMAGQQVAATIPQYALTVPTMQDSVAGDPATQSFMVEAYDDSSHHWFSGVLTARSVDNLAPAAITSAFGMYSNGSTSLFWNGVADADLCCYDVYRGDSPGFVPGPGNRVASTTQLSSADPYGAPAYYRIAARDIHGNVGPSALVVPQGTLAAGDEGPREWKLRSTWSAASGALELALDVPHEDAGRVELFDVTGRRLWSQGYRIEAARSLTFRVASGATLPPGLVYARATSASGRQLVARAIVMR